MKGTFEVTARKNGRRTVFYLTVALYNGIANTIHDHMKARGYKNINVRLVF